MSPAKFRWGLILIQIGIIVLLFNIDVIGDSAIEDMLVLFPVVLIAIGIEKLFTNTKLSFIAYLSSIALFLGGFFVVLQSSHGGVYYDDFFSESTFQIDLTDDIERINANLKLDGADLKIRDTGKDLIYARFDKFTRKPKITHDVSGGISSIEIESRSGNFLGGAIKINSDEPQDWYIRFAEDIPVSLQCEGDEAYIHLNLASTMLEKLKLDADNSEIYIKLGDLMPEVKVEISGVDSDLKLRIPETSGITISGSEIKNYLLQLGFIETDNGDFVNEGYDEYENHIKLEIDNKIDNIVLDMY